MQGAGFAGGATGANLARDIEQGWFDRLLTSPAPRVLLLAGPVLGAMTRALLPTTIVLSTGLVLGAGLPGGLPGLLALYLAAVWLCMVMSLWGSALALRARSQQVGPLIQNGVFLAVFLSTAYTPQGLLDGWLGEFAKYNPVSYVLQMARQATVSGIEPSWAHTWPGLRRAARHDARARRVRDTRAAAHGQLARPAAPRRARPNYQCTPFIRFAIAICSMFAFSCSSFSPFAAAESGKTL